MSNYYCPHCGADLGDQPGFDSNSGYWTCTECGQFLTDPEDSDPSAQYDGVGWFCDGCGAYLNKQSGFSDWYSAWTCTECGHVNNISDDEIYDSEEDYQASKSQESGNANEDDYAYGIEWMYDHPRRCKYCDRLLNKQEGYSDWLDYFTCEKCGFYNEWSNNNGDDEDEDVDSDSYYESDEEDDDEVESYFDSEEYQRRMQEAALRREEEARRREEEERRREEKRRIKAEQKKKRRKQFWRTITRKKQAVGISFNQCRTMNYEDVIKALKGQEFYNISTRVLEDLPVDRVAQEGIVENVTFNSTNTFDATTQFPFNAKIEIVYHMLRRQMPPLTSKGSKRKDIDDVVWEFSNAGFVNIEKTAIPDLKKGWLVKDESVESVTIDGKSDFKRNEWIRIDAHIVICYHTFKNNRK